MNVTARRTARRLMFVDPPVPPDPNGPASAGGGTGDEPKVFTQEQVNLFTSREATAAQKRTLDALGFDSIEKAQAALQAQKDAERAKMDEADRKVADAADKEAAAAEALRTAALKAANADRRAALATAGVSRADMADAVALLGAGGLADDADEATIDAAVEALRARRAELFSGKGATGTPPTPSTTPPGFPPAPGSSTKAKEESRGAAMARARYGSAARLPQQQGA